MSFDPNDILDPLSGLELKKCAEWLKENNWWDTSAPVVLSAADEQFCMDVALLIENLQYLNTADREIVAVLAKRFKNGDL